MPNGNGGPFARKALAHNLRVLRATRRLSQNVLAEEAGVTQALVSAIELGKANPTLASLERIAQVLKVDMSELFLDRELWT
jgi:transcriptional regulator with XRE-family HTH domain